MCRLRATGSIPLVSPIKISHPGRGETVDESGALQGSDQLIHRAGGCASLRLHPGYLLPLFQSGEIICFTQSEEIICFR
jgi:hypothetical protein